MVSKCIRIASTDILNSKIFSGEILPTSLTTRWKLPLSCSPPSKTDDGPAEGSQGELLVWNCASIYQCMCVSTHSDINISETIGSIAIKFYLTHNCGGWLGLGCNRFSDRLDKNSGYHGHRWLPLTYNGAICCGHSTTFIFDWIFFILTGSEDNQKSRMSSISDQIGLITLEILAIELKKIPIYL